MTTEIIGYKCLNDEAEVCGVTCASFDECALCDCVPQYAGAGPWGEAMDVIMCLLPLVFLLAATLWPRPLPTTVSLPLSALLMFLVRTMYLGSDPLLCSGAVVLGVHEAFTPLSIMAGAIMLFETMEATKCMPFIMREMKALTQGHPVTEITLLFCFAYMVEGASGFGTPVALGAPMMVSLGYPKFESVVCLLCLNTFATVWGAVGTPIWFGFGNLDFGPYAPATTEDAFLQISQKSGVALAISGFLLVPLVYMFVVPWRILVKNGWYVFLGLACCLLPAFGLSFVSYEFPSLLGGLVGCGLNAVLIHYQVGIKPYTKDEAVEQLGRDVEEIGTVSEKGVVAPMYQQQMSSMSKNSTTVYGNHMGQSLRDEAGLLQANCGVVSHSTETTTVGVGVGVVDKTDGGDVEMEHNGATTRVSFKENDEEQQVVGVGANADFGESLRSFDSQKITRAEDDDVKADEVAAAMDADSNTAIVPSLAEDPPLKRTETQEQAAQEASEAFRAVARGGTNGGGGGGSCSSVCSLSASQRAIEDAIGPRLKVGEGYIKECIGRTFPIWATVLLLILTRIPQIGLKALLTKEEPSFSIYFGSWGTFKLSASLVFQLMNILTYPGLNWKYEFLYVPFFLPFALVSFLTMWIYRRNMVDGHRCKDVIQTVLSRLTDPAIAITGALVLVQLMLKEGDGAPATIIGTILSDAMGGGFIAIAAFLGVLGSFFSGSTTISNLTFGNIQLIASQTIGTSATGMLALQATGASAGNGVCLNNIISACAVVGLQVGEGKIIGQTYKIVVPLTIMVTVWITAFFLRFGEPVL
jgi:L-lactate permease